MRSGAGGWGVLVLGAVAASDVEMLAANARAAGAGRGGNRLAFALVDDVDAALTRLASCPDLAWVVVIDPRWAVENPDEAQRLCLTLAFETRPVRIVPWGAPTPAAMRGVALCSRWVACDLVVRGVEDDRLLEIASWGTAREEGRDGPLDPASSVVQLMPARPRDAWAWVVHEPERATVKGVAGRVGLTRRRLERWHRSVGVPSPGRLLRSLTLLAPAVRRRG